MCEASERLKVKKIDGNQTSAALGRSGLGHIPLRRSHTIHTETSHGSDTVGRSGPPRAHLQRHATRHGTRPVAYRRGFRRSVFRRGQRPDLGSHAVLGSQLGRARPSISRACVCGRYRENYQVQNPKLLTQLPNLDPLIPTYTTYNKYDITDVI